MKFKGLIPLLVITLVSSGLYRGIKKITASERAKKLSMKFDPSLSQKFRETMISFLQEQEKTTVTPALIAERIKDQFQMVKKISVQTRSDGKLRIEVVPHRPIALVNNTHLLVKEGKLVHAEDVVYERVQQLPVLMLAGDH